MNNCPPFLCSHDIIPPGAYDCGGGAGWEGGLLPGAGRTHHSLGQPLAAQESSELSQEVPEAMCGRVVSQNAPFTCSSCLCCPHSMQVSLDTLNKVFSPCLQLQTCLLLTHDPSKPPVSVFMPGKVLRNHKKPVREAMEGHRFHLEGQGWKQLFLVNPVLVNTWDWLT